MIPKIQKKYIKSYTGYKKIVQLGSGKRKLLVFPYEILLYILKIQW